MMPSLNLTNHTAIITGGTRGIGRCIAESFLEAGADVVTCARNEPSEPVEASGRRASFVACDVREPDQVSAVVDHAVATHGRLDVLVNNAGGAPPADSATASPRFNERIIALNLLAPITFAQAVHNQMQSQPQGGVIINISSVSGVRANPMGVAYGAAKAGLINVTKTLAVEWGPKIRVVTITSGLVLTDDSRAFYGDDESVAKVANTMPLERMGTPEDVANACLFVASDAASWVSGANFEVHGGGEKVAYLDATDAL